MLGVVQRATFPVLKSELFEHALIEDRSEAV